MNRQNSKKFAQGIPAPNAVPRAELAIADIGKASGLNLRIDSVDGQVRGLYWQEGKAIILGSIDDLISLHELLSGKRPDSDEQSEAWDRMLNRLSDAIEKASLAKVSPQYLPNCS